MGENWQDPDLERMQKGMLLLGWRADSRLTSEDEAQLTPLVEEAIQLKDEGKLGPDQIDELSLEVYKVIAFQLMNVTERARIISSAYSDSKYLAPLVPMIDQATCCFYCGYFTAALATLFIIIESYLRNLLAWCPGQPNPTFAELRAAVKRLPECESRDEAEAVLHAMYARYDAQNPPQFHFNRHGLLHGIRRDMVSLDHMNCVRTYLLMDLLCRAEGVYSGGYIFAGGDDIFYKREGQYRKCMEG